jgi:hypothetical protein
MKIISHRGNLNGRLPDRENHPSYIQAAIDAGYDVEVDVWYVDGEFYLGHDEPQYKVLSSWLKELNRFLWCHAKNGSALDKMLELGLHCFWHEQDCFTLTSMGVPWCYPCNYQPRGVTVVLDASINNDVVRDVFGVCTDHPLLWKQTP